jgi:hypothetical protein
MFVFRPNKRRKCRRQHTLLSTEGLEPRDVPAVIVPVETGVTPTTTTAGTTNLVTDAQATLQVQAVQRRGLHALPSRFTIVFNQALEPSRATNLSNYLLIAEGPDLAVGTADDFPVPLRPVRYQPGSTNVTLTTVRPVALIGREYVLAIDGNPATGIVSADGEPLQGNGGAGTDVFTIVNVDNFIPPVAVTRAIATPSGRQRTPATGIIRNG